MYSPTYDELSNNLMMELDIQDETFITPDELLSYFNEGVSKVEAEIHTIYEDYFLTNAPLSFTSGTSQYALPADIYAQKIRQLWFNDNGARCFEILKVKQLKEIPYLQQIISNTIYKWMLTNATGTGLMINIYPTPQETVTYTTLWYIRTALRFSGAPTDVCDIPEFTSVIVQYVRWKCLDKEGHPDTQAALLSFQAMNKQMVETLSARIPDEHNEMIQDFSFYQDFDDWSGGNY